ncbi:MAG: DUF4062 domain-containing protein [Planctomycetota bacterium]|nr:DUF4062 domain-containing protein [Planctomycetota bacterium]
MSQRVFLSSTFTDLADHRVPVREGLRIYGASDVSMENFGARDERPADECLRLIREESDLFVGIYAHRYGFIPDQSKISITEMEYHAAADARLPCLIYLVDENEPCKPAFVDEGENRQKLQAFKNALMGRHICKTFKNPDQLATFVVADVARHFAKKNATRVGKDIPVADVGVNSLRTLVDDVGLESAAPVESVTPDDWSNRRRQVYTDSRKIFLTHTIEPSSKPGQTFDVYIYLIRHDSDNLSDVLFAEFFLGPYWGNKVFPAVLQNGFIGIATSAYGTFLCVCRVTFRDGKNGV